MAVSGKNLSDSREPACMTGETAAYSLIQKCRFGSVPGPASSLRGGPGPRGRKTDMGGMTVVQAVRDMVWGPWLTGMFLLTGIYFTVRFRGFQIFGFRRWWRATAGSLFREDGGTGEGEKKEAGKRERGRAEKTERERKRGQAASACTALAATVGTGNIAGVATAVAAGGPGAVFWMWVSAVAGMMTAYAEVYLGRKYRYQGADGRPVCGPYAYLDRGLGMKRMGLLYAWLCVLASLGMGSMVQASAVAESAAFAWDVPLPAAGLVLTILVMAVIFGGAGRISGAAVRLVPFSAAFYMGLCAVILLANAAKLPAVFEWIVRDAFSAGSAAGGMSGVLVSRAVSCGLSRGVFSNEAGLGSLAVLHGEAGDPDQSAQEREQFAREQGMWAVFEVFFDTIVSCTVTALVLLCVLGTGTDGAAGAGGYGAVLGEEAGSAAVAACFSACFGELGGALVAVSTSLFAFATIIAWYYLGRQALGYIAQKNRNVRLIALCYGFFYLNAVFFGCVARLTLVWNLSDIFNGLMAVPNLIGVLLLRREVK